VNDTPPAGGDALAVARRVDEACNRFELAWRSGPPPRVEDFLGDPPGPGHAALLRELVLLDVYYRRRRGAAPAWEEYRRRFPDLDPTAPAEAETDPSVTPELPGPDLAGADRAPDPVGGRRFGTYELLEEVGRGGMGIVYQARQGNLNRTVALKMILMGPHALPAERERFRREAEAAAQLDHPHIVPIYEVGECEGRPYFTMKLLDGGTLAQALSSQPSAFSPKDAARLVATVARAVHHAHRHGILHRDLKPANILLAADGVAGGATPQAAWVPHVTDFGLARRVEGDSSLTQSGVIVGTPSYMAPEQAHGQGRRLSTAADVYALGVILYELLVGRPPFKAATPLDTLVQVMHEPPVPPRRLRPGLPRDLETVCLKCLQKEPGKRYATAEALAEDLRRFLAGEPVQARAVGPAGRLWHWCRRNRLAAALIGLVALVLLAGTAVSSYFAVRADRKATEAETNAQSARNEQLRSERRLYVAMMNLTHQAWKDGQTNLVLQRLDDWVPQRPEDQDLRGFEHHYLRRLCRLDLATWPAHAALTSVAYSPDGRRLAAAGADHTIRVWDTATGQEVLTLSGHTDTVWCVAFSPDSRRLASIGEDRVIKVWDVGTGKERLSVPPAGAVHHEDVTHGIAFSPDGRRLATTDWDRTVRIRDADTGKELIALRGHADCVVTVAFSPDGRRLASGSMDSDVRVWDAADGREIFTLKGHSNYAWHVAFSPDGRRLASAGWDQTVRVWDLDTGREAFAPLRGHSNFVAGVAFSPDGKRLASASWDNTVKVWDLATRQELLTLRGHTREVEAVAFSPDGRCLASAADDQTVKIWDAAGADEALVLRGHTRHVQSVAFSPDGGRLASGCDDELIKLWDAASGEELLTWQGHAGGVGPVAFSPDGRRLASGGVDGLVKLWDAATGREILTLRGHAASARGLAFSPDGGRLASGETGEAPAVTVWDVATGQELLTLRGHTADVWGVAFSPDGRYLATGSNDRTARLWDAATGQELVTFRGHKMYVAGVAFSPDGARLATAGWDRSVSLWDTATGRRLVSMGGHTSWVQAVAFSPDGRRLVSVGADRTWKIWDTTTFNLLLSVPAHDAEVVGVAFSPDGLRLATGSWDHTVKVWDARPLTAEVLEQRQARSVVRFLTARGLPRADVLARIREDATLSEPVRQRALALAGR
jgi:WD40 repeat protein